LPTSIQPTTTFTRLGTVFSPDGSPEEQEGTVNPASARLRDGTLALYPRVVAAGNISRVGFARGRWQGDTVTFERDGYALEPKADYEFRITPGDYGCEDPRVTYFAPLDLYLMTYCSYGPQGTAVAVAHSKDGVTWERLGTVWFPAFEISYGDKDAVFFPDVVLSPSGVPSIALLHRPTMHLSVAAGRGLIPSILAMEPADRESIWISYVSLERVRANLSALLDVEENVQLMHPEGTWGAIKLGAGPPPVRIREGWLLVYHGIDVLPHSPDVAKNTLEYCAGIAILDAQHPDRVLYRAPSPFLTPTMPEEIHGVVDNVVFPTAIDPRPDIGPRSFDIYYGMADTLIGRGRLNLAD